MEHKRPPRGLALALATLAVLLCTPAAAWADEIYKCVDAAGKVTYQATPCKGGAKLAIDAGNYDPAAAAQLQSEHVQFAAREAQRQQAAERDEDKRLARDALAQRKASDAAPAPASNDACIDCGWGGFLPFPLDGWRGRPPRPKPPPPPVQPSPPSVMPGIPRAQPGPVLAPAPPSLPDSGR